MTTLKRRRVLQTMTVAALTLPFTAPAALAANPAETFIADNIHLGFELLNNRTLSAAQRKERFAAFLIGLTDMRRVALFMLGRYANGLAPADADAFVAAYRDFALAVYQSYFAQYAGQNLRVIDSRERAANDFVVRTNLVGDAPLEIDFRVRTDGPKPVLVDLSVAGIWLALAQRDEFSAVLGQSNGDIKALIAHLRSVQQQYQ